MQLFITQQLSVTCFTFPLSQVLIYRLKFVCYFDVSGRKFLCRKILDLLQVMHNTKQASVLIHLIKLCHCQQYALYRAFRQKSRRAL